MTNRMQRIKIFNLFIKLDNFQKKKFQSLAMIKYI